MSLSLLVRRSAPAALVAMIAVGLLVSAGSASAASSWSIPAPSPVTVGQGQTVSIPVYTDWTSGCVAPPGAVCAFPPTLSLSAPPDLVAQVGPYNTGNYLTLIHYSISPSRVTAGNTSTLTVTAAADAPCGSRNVTITATTPYATHTTQLTLRVCGAIWTSQPTAPEVGQGWIPIAREGQQLTLGNTTSKTAAGTHGQHLVRYGAGEEAIYRPISDSEFATGSVSCTNQFFGTDPYPGVVKSCAVGGTWRLTTWEGGSFTMPTLPTPDSSSATVVRYGVSSTPYIDGCCAVWGVYVDRPGYKDKLAVDATTTAGMCTDDFFGGDPWPGSQPKGCYKGTPSAAS